MVSIRCSSRQSFSLCSAKQKNLFRSRLNPLFIAANILTKKNFSEEGLRFVSIRCSSRPKFSLDSGAVIGTLQLSLNPLFIAAEILTHINPEDLTFFSQGLNPLFIAAEILTACSAAG